MRAKCRWCNRSAIKDLWDGCPYRQMLFLSTWVVLPVDVYGRVDDLEPRKENGERGSGDDERTQKEEAETTS